MVQRHTPIHIFFLIHVDVSGKYNMKQGDPNSKPQTLHVLPCVDSSLAYIPTYTRMGKNMDKAQKPSL